jgi:DUF1680 family protein
MKPQLLPLSWSWSLVLAVTAVAAAAVAPGPAPVPWKVAARVPDAAELASPAAVKLQGFLGERVRLNAVERLAKVDVEPLLAGFRKKPGVHPWIGEHIGKWMHAATLAWAYTGDATLKTKLDYAAAELIKAQEADGYLGTYTPDKRFGLFEGADWDVWSHKYCLMGLLTYHQFTGNAAALAASRKAADLLVATFPAKRSILAAGTHVGMAATSVLEPMVLLYRLTGEKRYLEFCQYLVKSWDEANGPKILATLLAVKQVNQTANAKAYETLSNLVGLSELYRVTGERNYLEAALNAWQDIVANRLYVTGGASQGEHFRADHDLPNAEGAHVAETCVTTTWIQLNEQLLRLTGEARFGDELERTFYNHLAAAQRPDGAQWCYFTSLEGRKPYGPGINCCVSSGPRGMALVPPAAAFTYRAGGASGIAVNLFELESFTTVIAGQPVRLRVATKFPREGGLSVSVETGKPVAFALKVRQPAWAGGLGARSAGSLAVTIRDGWFEIPSRTWKAGDMVEFTYDLASRLVLGEHGNAGKAALAWGPFILAHESTANPGGDAAALLGFASPQPPVQCQSGAGERLRFDVRVQSARRMEAEPVVLVPFADAGGSGGLFRVWLRAPGAPPLPVNPSLLAYGIEGRSREGNVAGSINDGDPGTYVVTFEGRARPEDWFSVALPGPVTVARVVFTQGRLFHDGGWFDASAGRPRVQIQTQPNGPWSDAGTLVEYPATTATDSAGLKEGQGFTLKLPAPVAVVGVRVIGQPAAGDNPAQAFAACAELEAFAE